jgi:hypothetical protein
MRYVIKIIVIAFSILFFCNVTIAAEKPLIIKGLYIGMDINDARNILIQLLGKEWKIGIVGDSKQVLQDYRFGEEKIFGTRDKYLGTFTQPNVGDRGFAIIDNYNTYEGYMSCNNNDKVTRISFGGRLTDAIFSAAKVNAEDFASAFWNTYNMPEFNWIPYGWQYISPNGYSITIKTDKLIDIKVDTIVDTIRKPNSKIKFD